MALGGMRIAAHRSPMNAQPVPFTATGDWPTCAHCGAPVTSTAERAAADVLTLSHIRTTHCLYCTNLAVCGAACEKCGYIPAGGPCEMER
jgi:hypothetical protein